MSLLVHPKAFENRIEDFGLKNLSFSVRKLATAQKYEATITEVELAIVVLGGVCSVRTSMDNWQSIGKRATVFDGMPYTIYLPPGT